MQSLRVEGVPDGKGGMYLLVEIPPEPGHPQPFLVKGALIGEKFRGEYISVVERRDADSEPIRIATIHAWITAGRAFLEHRAHQLDTSEFDPRAALCRGGCRCRCRCYKVPDLTVRDIRRAAPIT